MPIGTPQYLGIVTYLGEEVAGTSASCSAGDLVFACAASQTNVDGGWMEFTFGDTSLNFATSDGERSQIAYFMAEKDYVNEPVSGTPSWAANIQIAEFWKVSGITPLAPLDAWSSLSGTTSTNPTTGSTGALEQNAELAVYVAALLYGEAGNVGSWNYGTRLRRTSLGLGLLAGIVCDCASIQTSNSGALNPMLSLTTKRKWGASIATFKGITSTNFTITPSVLSAAYAALPPTLSMPTPGEYAFSSVLPANSPYLECLGYKFISLYVTATDASLLNAAVLQFSWDKTNWIDASAAAGVTVSGAVGGGRLDQGGRIFAFNGAGMSPIPYRYVRVYAGANVAPAGLDCQVIHRVR